jgi:hypothetical protein
LLTAGPIQANDHAAHPGRVMLGHDLAELYGVPTGQLNRAVQRNAGRFPADFMFRLTRAEDENLRCQIGISSQYGGRRYLPYAFTEQGVAMLSAVLQSPRAIAVSVEIIRVFVRLRQLLASHQDLARTLDALEHRLIEHDEKFAIVFDAIRELMDEGEKRRRRSAIGYHSEATPAKKRKQAKP